MGFLLSPLYWIDINFFSHEWYRGSTRGFEFSVSDLLLISLSASLILRQKVFDKKDKSIIWFPKGSLPIFLFLILANLSLLQAEVKIFGLFELTKMVKGMLVFWVAANVASSSNLLKVGFVGVCVMIAFEVAYGATQHFTGRYRIPGSLPHPNSLAMFLNMLIPILWAYLLYTETKKTWWLYPILMGGITVVLLTFSRGGWLGLLVGMGIVTAVSFLKKPSLKLVGVSLVGILILSGLIVKEWPHLADRWTNAPKASLTWRIKANEMAYSMIRQSPYLGIGINNSPAWLSSRANRQTNQNPSNLAKQNIFNSVLESTQTGDPNTHHLSQEILETQEGLLIHNIYLLTAVETGLLGLTAFLLIGIRLGWIAIKTITRRNKGIDLIFALGITGSLAATYLQGIAEWELRQTQIFYVFWTLMGILTGISAIHPKGNRS